MMKRIGFLGCGKIGQILLDTVLTSSKGSVSFIQDTKLSFAPNDIPIVRTASPDLLAKTDVVVEVATADVLKENTEHILKHADLLPFSLTAFADEQFYQHTKTLLEKYNRTLFLPHGAILGIDGLLAGRTLLKSVSIKTIKHPSSLSLSVDKATVLFDGSAKQACEKFPRNVNVHACIALAGLGFEHTHSQIIADPDEPNNTHYITIDGEGFHFEIKVSSITTGGVSGEYTLQSAKDSILKVCDYTSSGIKFL